MSSCEGNPRKDLTQPFTCCKYAGVIFRHAGTSTSPLVNSISALESQALGFEQLVGIFNELQTIFINAFFPSFSEGSSNILQIFQSSFLFFFATEEYEFNSGNVFTNSSAILDFCLPPPDAKHYGELENREYVVEFCANHSLTIKISHGN